MSSFFHSRHDHPSKHTHSSPDHQHGPLHDSSIHSPHRHNRAASPAHHPSLHSQETHFGTPDPTYHDKMTTDTTNSGQMNNSTNLQATAPQSQDESTNFSSTRNNPSNSSTSNPLDTHSNTSNSNQAKYISSDPTTAPHASSTSKILGDLKGMAHGAAGSVQAAIGTTFGQKGMAEKGFEKMSEEDARLAAKSGKPPVGMEQRSTTVNAGHVSTEHGQGLSTDKTL